MKTKVLFTSITKNNKNNIADIARRLLEKTISDNNIKLEKEIPLKIHPGTRGNISYVRAENYQGIIDFLKEKNIKTYYIETNTATGPRSNTTSHLQVIKENGFANLPFVIADGEKGFDHVKVKIDTGKHFQSCLIAGKLAEPKQIIVTSHFKGHIMSGFGGAIKQLGIGFASARGKIDAHCKITIPDNETIDWSKRDILYDGKEFRQRSAEYALAAVNHKQYLYVTYAISIVENCDCDGAPMKPIYEDLGIFASLDPVAIDKACFDLLQKREGKKPFDGDDIFAYAEEIGLGSTQYELIQFS